jgi:hypothetical protein
VNAVYVNNSLLKLLQQAPLCGQDTTVSATDISVVWQDTRSSDFQNTSPPRLHLPAKVTENRFDNGPAVGGVDALITLFVALVAHSQRSVPADGGMTAIAQP